MFHTRTMNGMRIRRNEGALVAILFQFLELSMSVDSVNHLFTFCKLSWKDDLVETLRCLLSVV